MSCALTIVTLLSFLLSAACFLPLLCYIHTLTHPYTLIYTHLHSYAHTHIHTHMYTNTHSHVHMHRYMTIFIIYIINKCYIGIHIYVHIYIHTYVLCLCQTINYKTYYFYLLSDTFPLSILFFTNLCQFLFFGIAFGPSSFSAYTAGFQPFLPKVLPLFFTIHLPLSPTKSRGTLGGHSQCCTFYSFEQ